MIKTQCGKDEIILNRSAGRGWVIAGAIVLIVLLIGGSIIGTYNSLVAGREGVNTAYSNIQTDLQRRNDLVPNLVETVKGYAKHEEQIYTAIANARAAMMSAGNMQEAAKANGELSSALSRLLAISEAYPQLKANENFINLQTQLEGTENRISVARTKYNDTVKTYNQKISSFPSNVFAGVFGFQKAEYFEAAAGAEKVPNVKF